MKYWEEKEIEYLKKAFGRIPAKEIAIMLDRSVNSVCGKAWAMGLRSRMYSHSESERVKAGIKPPGRTETSYKIKRAKLKHSKGKRNNSRWSKDDLKDLKRLCSTEASWKTISIYFGRSMDSVKAMARLRGFNSDEARKYGPSVERISLAEISLLKSVTKIQWDLFPTYDSFLRGRDPEEIGLIIAGFDKSLTVYRYENRRPFVIIEGVQTNWIHGTIFQSSVVTTDSLLKLMYYGITQAPTFLELVDLTGISLITIRQFLSKAKI